MSNTDMENDNKYHERSRAAQKSTLVSVVVNIFLACFQVIVGIFSGSQGLIADGMHSFSDLVADFVVLIANKKSRKPSDDDHHYGHWRYENGASLVIGLILFLVGGIMLWSALGKILHPDSIPEVHMAALWVALAAIAIKELLFRYMLRVANRVQSSMLVANAWHARSDAASSVVVAIGIIGNLAGYTWFDPVAAMIVGAMIALMGYRFSANAMNDLMDRSVDAEIEEEIRQTILAVAGVEGLHDLKTRKAGDLILVDAHLEVNAWISVKEGHDIAVEVKHQVLKDDRILDIMLHVDPVIPGTGELV